MVHRELRNATFEGEKHKPKFEFRTLLIASLIELHSYFSGNLLPLPFAPKIAAMCTIIVTIRSVLWYVMSLAGTLMILVALFTNRWLDGTYTASSLGSARNVEKTLTNVFDAVSKGDVNQVGFYYGLI